MTQRMSPSRSHVKEFKMLKPCEKSKPFDSYKDYKPPGGGVVAYKLESFMNMFNSFGIPKHEIQTKVH